MRGKRVKRKVAVIVTIALVIVGIGSFRNAIVSSSSTNIASDISWSCISVDNEQVEASMSWEQLIHPPEFTDSTSGSFSKAPTAAGFTFNIKSTGKDAVYTNGVATADNPTNLKVYSTGTMNVVKGKTYTASFKIKSTLYGKKYENGEVVTDESGNETSERNYIKHIGFRIYDEATNQEINFSNASGATTGGIIELNGQDTEKKTVTVSFTVPQTFPSNKINAQFLFGARMVTYPNEVSMKGNVIVTQFQVSESSDAVETTTKAGGETVAETTQGETNPQTQKPQETTTTGTVPEEINISDDLNVVGYQMTSYFRNNPGVIGHRIIYSTGKTVEGQVPQEVGVVFGFDYDSSLAEDDFVVNSDHPFVATHKATQYGTINYAAGDSLKNYYALTMDSGQISLAFTTSYIVRIYAKLSDGSYVYSNFYDFNVFNVSDYLYQNGMLPMNSYGYILNNVLRVVNSNYGERDSSGGEGIVPAE